MYTSPNRRSGFVPGVAGFTLLETSVATMMVGSFVAMLMVMTSNVLGLLRTCKDDVSASQALQQRVEEMRIANWEQITDANYIKTDLLAADTGSTKSITKAVETITISAYPKKTGVTDVKVIRQNGATTVVSANPALIDERMVRVDMELKWQGFPKMRQRVRAATALIAKGGISK